MDELKPSEVSKLIKSLRSEAVFQADRFGRRIFADELNEAADALEKLVAEKQDTDAHLKAINDSLSEQLCRAASENKPLTLEQLEFTIENHPKDWLWLEDLADSENSIYQRNDKTYRWSNITNYAKMWIAYAHKPEGSTP